MLPRWRTFRVAQLRKGGSESVEHRCALLQIEEEVDGDGVGHGLRRNSAAENRRFGGERVDSFALGLLP